MKSLALVIPCKDEAKRLVVGPYLEAINRYPYLTFLFVDDGSTDATADTLAFLEHVSPSIRALYLPKNVGKAEAVRTGVNWLLAHTDCEAVGFWDADLATPLTELPAFVRALDDDPKCQAAIGARWPHLGVAIDRDPFRRFTGGLMRLIIRRIVRATVYDTQCGAKIFRRACAARAFARPFLTRWLFDVEILRRFAPGEANRVVREIPLGFWRDVAGSKLTFADSLRVFPDLLRIALWA